MTDLTEPEIPFQNDADRRSFEILVSLDPDIVGEKNARLAEEQFKTRLRID
jgi:hypothetical protein